MAKPSRRNDESTNEDNLREVAIEDEYRKVPRELGWAHDPRSIGKFNLANDNVSVVHSGESDPMPNREAQEAYMDEAGAAKTSSVARGKKGYDEAAGRNDSEIGLETEDERTSDLYKEDPESPTDAGSTLKADDENDFEFQQQFAEQSGLEEEAS